MNLFADVSFGPGDVRATVNGGTSPRCVRMAVLTSQTCGEACWHAREEICRCSCGGRNHGCLLIPGGEMPERSAKIDGHRYVLAGVGLRSDLYAMAEELNGQHWKSVNKPTVVIDSMGAEFSEIEQAMKEGKEVWFSQYVYSWSETDAGAPARIKPASKDQMSRWTELAAWQDKARQGVCLLWRIAEMPGAPKELVVNKETGLPLDNQSPIGEQI